MINIPGVISIVDRTEVVLLGHSIKYDERVLLPTSARRYALTVICLVRHAYLVSEGLTIEAIAEPTRRLILEELRRGEHSVNSLVERLAMSQPAVSKHLRVLRGAGLVTSRAEGQRRLYRICPKPLVELDAWLEPYREIWSSSLDKLEQRLDESQPSRRKTP